VEKICCYQPLIQTYAVQSKSGIAHSPQTLDQYISTSINSLDGEDILKLSCCLGFLSFHGVESARDNRTVDKVEDCYLYCVGRLREICKINMESLRYNLQARNIRTVIYILAVTSLHHFNPKYEYSEEGEAFLWQMTNCKEGLVNRMAVATFCVSIWPFVKETLAGEQLEFPEVTMVQYEARWYIRLQYKRQAPRLFDVADAHQAQDCGSSEDQIHRSYDHLLKGRHLETAIAKEFLVECIKMESKRTLGRQVGWLRLILDWDKKLDVRLCCFLPFVQLVKFLLESGCTQKQNSVLPDIQVFLSRHATHERSPSVDEAVCPTSTYTGSNLRNLLDEIASLVDTGHGADMCSSRDVFAASVAVGAATDALLRRAEASLHP
jgi:hypothetical protein